MDFVYSGTYYFVTFTRGPSLFTGENGIGKSYCLINTHENRSCYPFIYLPYFSPCLLHLVRNKCLLYYDVHLLGCLRCFLMILIIYVNCSSILRSIYIFLDRIKIYGRFSLTFYLIVFYGFYRNLWNVVYVTFYSFSKDLFWYFVSTLFNSVWFKLFYIWYIHLTFWVVIFLQSRGV